MRLRYQGQPVHPHLYEIADLTFALRCETECGMILLYGIITADDEADMPILVRLMRPLPAESLVDEALLEAGSFELGPVPPGDYHLEVLQPDRLLVIGGVTLPLTPASHLIELKTT